MADTLVKSVMLKIRPDDGDTEAKLDSISRKADELGAKHPELTVRINSAAASAKLAVLKAELKDTGSTSTDAKGKLSALGGALNALTLGVSGGVGQMTMFQKVMAGLGLATGLGEPLVAGLTVAVGGLSSGLVAAGAGLGAFGLVAKSNLTAASTAATAVQNAQIAYTSAVATGTKQATAYATEQKAILTAYAQLSPAQIAMSKQIGDVQNSWQSFVQANTTGVDAVMTRGIGLLPKVFASMQPLMAPTEKALGGLVGQLGKGLDSKGFTSFISMLATNSGPAITKLGDAIGHIGVGLGGLIKAFMPFAQQMLGGLDQITAKFATWGTTLTGHSGFQSLMTMFHQETPIVMNDLKQLAGIVKTVVSSMAGMTTVSNSTSLFKLAGPILAFANALLKAHPGLVNLILYTKLASDSLGKLGKAFGGLSTGVSVLKDTAKGVSNLAAGFTDAEAAGSEATGLLGTFGGKLSVATSAMGKFGAAIFKASTYTKIWTGIQAAFDLVMDANPIVLIVIAIVALIAVIVILTIKFKFMRDFWKDAWRDIKNWAVDGWHAIDKAFHSIVSSITGAWAAVKAVTQQVIGWIRDYITTEINIVKTVLGWFGQLGSLFRGWWNDGVNAVKSAAGTMVSFVQSIPGKILSALGNLGNLLYNAGRNVISGLVNGIKSMIGAVGGAMSDIGSEVLDHIPHSPAKKGPLSGSGDPRLGGMRIAQMLASGIAAGTPAVSASAHGMAQAAVLGAGGGPAGGGQMELAVSGAGAADWMAMVKALWPDLRLEVRSKGGAGPFSTQRALGEVVPA